MGLLIESNGNKYEGEFRNDKKHGEGIAFQKEDGTVWHQQWKNGVLISSAKLSDGNIFLLPLLFLLLLSSSPFFFSEYSFILSWSIMGEW
jgi:hypothetical protein